MRKKWEKTNKLITQELGKLQQRVSAANIYKLFMSSLDQTYWHTYFFDKKNPFHKKVYQQLEPEYEGPTNLTHFTVHEFNEAVYFAMKEFSNYVNFAQVESATYNFFMDQILDEQNKARKKPLKPVEDNFGKLKATKGQVVKRDNTGRIISDASDDEDVNEETIYPINQNGPKKLTAYSHIFVNHMPCKTIAGNPKKKTY